MGDTINIWNLVLTLYSIFTTNLFVSQQYPAGKFCENIPVSLVDMDWQHIHQYWCTHMMQHQHMGRFLDILRHIRTHK